LFPFTAGSKTTSLCSGKSLITSRFGLCSGSIRVMQSSGGGGNKGLWREDCSNVSSRWGVVIHHPDLSISMEVRSARETRIRHVVETPEESRDRRNARAASHAFICGGVTSKPACSVGPAFHVHKDPHPRAVNPRGDAPVRHEKMEFGVPITAGARFYRRTPPACWRDIGERARFCGGTPARS